MEWQQSSAMNNEFDTEMGVERYPELAVWYNKEGGFSRSSHSSTHGYTQGGVDYQRMQAPPQQDPTTRSNVGGRYASPALPADIMSPTNPLISGGIDYPYNYAMTMNSSPNYRVETGSHRLSITQDSSGASSAVLDPSLTPNDGGRNDGGSISRSSSQSKNPVVCKYCKTTLSGIHANGNLTRHLKSQKCSYPGKKNEYPCDTCIEKVFKRSDGLLKHKRRKHGAPPPRKKNV